MLPKVNLITVESIFRGSILMQSPSALDLDSIVVLFFMSVCGMILRWVH